MILNKGSPVHDGQGVDELCLGERFLEHLVFRCEEIAGISPGRVSKLYADSGPLISQLLDLLHGDLPEVHAGKGGVGGYAVEPGIVCDALPVNQERVQSLVSIPRDKDDASPWDKGTAHIGDALHPRADEYIDIVLLHLLSNTVESLLMVDMDVHTHPRLIGLYVW